MKTEFSKSVIERIEKFNENKKNGGNKQVGGRWFEDYWKEEAHIPAEILAHLKKFSKDNLKEWTQDLYKLVSSYIGDELEKDEDLRQKLKNFLKDKPIKEFIGGFFLALGDHVIKKANGLNKLIAAHPLASIIADINLKIYDTPWTEENFPSDFLYACWLESFKTSAFDFYEKHTEMFYASLLGSFINPESPPAAEIKGAWDELSKERRGELRFELYHSYQNGLSMLKDNNDTKSIENLADIFNLLVLTGLIKDNEFEELTKQLSKNKPLKEKLINKIISHRNFHELYQDYEIQRNNPVVEEIVQSAIKVHSRNYKIRESKLSKKLEENSFLLLLEDFAELKDQLRSNYSEEPDVRDSDEPEATDPYTHSEKVENIENIWKKTTMEGRNELVYKLYRIYEGNLDSLEELAKILSLNPQSENNFDSLLNRLALTFNILIITGLIEDTRFEILTERFNASLMEKLINKIISRKDFEAFKGYYKKIQKVNPIAAKVVAAHRQKELGDAGASCDDLSDRICKMLNEAVTTEEIKEITDAGMAHMRKILERKPTGLARILEILKRKPANEKNRHLSAVKAHELISKLKNDLADVTDESKMKILKQRIFSELKSLREDKNLDAHLFRKYMVMADRLTTPLGKLFNKAIQHKADVTQAIIDKLQILRLKIDRSADEEFKGERKSGPDVNELRTTRIIACFKQEIRELKFYTGSSIKLNEFANTLEEAVDRNNRYQATTIDLWQKATQETIQWVTVEKIQQEAKKNKSLTRLKDGLQSAGILAKAPEAAVEIKAEIPYSDVSPHLKHLKEEKQSRSEAKGQEPLEAREQESRDLRQGPYPKIDGIRRESIESIQEDARKILSDYLAKHPKSRAAFEYIAKNSSGLPEIEEPIPANILLRINELRKEDLMALLRSNHPPKNSAGSVSARAIVSSGIWQRAALSNTRKECPPAITRTSMR